MHFGLSQIGSHTVLIVLLFFVAGFAQPEQKNFSCMPGLVFFELISGLLFVKQHDKDLKIPLIIAKKGD